MSLSIRAATLAACAGLVLIPLLARAHAVPRPKEANAGASPQPAPHATTIRTGGPAHAR
jgi:hypothetical protein